LISGLLALSFNQSLVHQFTLVILIAVLASLIPYLFTTMTDLLCFIEGKANGKVAFLITAQTDHTLTIKGETDFNQNMKTVANIKGNNVLFSDSEDLSITLSPDLQLIYTAHQLKLSGSIRIPKANITPKDYSASVGLPKDVTFVKPSGQVIEDKNTLPLYSEITVSFGPNVFLKYKGINAKLFGQIRVVDKPKQATQGFGEIQARDGKFSKYGTTLTLNRANIHFSGPIDDPSLDIEAIKKFNLSGSNKPFSSNTLIAGVMIRGKASKPDIILFSDPAVLSKSDILSYLVLGMSASQASSDQGALLLRAASFLDGSGSSKGGVSSIMSSMKDSLGLSDVSLETTSTIDKDTKHVSTGTSLVIGKYLSPKIYISYSLGFVSNLNVFKVRYDFNRRWSVQTSASTQDTGADLFYTFESGN